MGGGSTPPGQAMTQAQLVEALDIKTSMADVGDRTSYMGDDWQRITKGDHMADHDRVDQIRKGHQLTQPERAAALFDQHRDRDQGERFPTSDINERLRKLREEAGELGRAALTGSLADIAEEAADVVLVALDILHISGGGSGATAIEEKLAVLEKRWA